MRKFHWSILSSLLLWCVFSTSAFADDSAPQITSDAVTNHTDLSMGYLGQIFGNVGNVMQGTSGQMLGHLFHDFNIGILCVVGLLLGYIVMTTVFRTATEGSFMGANKNVHILLLRVVLGTAFLMPSPSTGYSIIQDTVMKVVVEGVKLADMTWSHGLTYLSNGGTLWAPPENSGASGVDKNASSVGKENFTSIYQNLIIPVMTNEVCMEANEVASELQGGGSSNYVAPNLSPSEHKSGPYANQFTFPSLTSDTGCGHISWSLATGTKDATQLQMSHDNVYKAVYDLLPAAKAEACGDLDGKGSLNTATCRGLDPGQRQTDGSELMFTNIVNYINGVIPIARHQAGQAGQGIDAFLDNAKDGGWILAGRYYWDLMQLEDKYTKDVNISSYHPDAVEIASSDNPLVKAAISFVQANLSGKGAVKYMSTTQALFDKYLTANGAGDAASGSSGDLTKHSLKGSIFPFVSTIITGMSGSLSGIISQFNLSNPQYANPIYFLHSIGMKCLKVAGDIFFTIAIIAGLASMADMICQGETNLDTPFSTTMTWMMPIAIMIGTTLLGVALILGFYVPIYPFMLFLFGVIGWFVSVIEAMVAAPLVALGLTHPDGHDFLGEAKQGIMLLMGVFVRPVLMIIGLFAAMILTFVAFRILLFVFAGFCSDIMSWTANGMAGSGQVGQAFANINNNFSSSAGYSAVLVLPIMLVVFAGFTYLLVNQCFSLIYALPDNTLRWIGGPQGQSMAAQMANQMQGMFGQAGSAAGSAMKSGIEGAQKLGGAPVAASKVTRGNVNRMRGNSAAKSSSSNSASEGSSGSSGGGGSSGGSDS